MEIDDDDQSQRIAHLHFVRVNFKNGQMTDEKEYVYPAPWHAAVEEARAKSGGDSGE